jgi:hypothetical protein
VPAQARRSHPQSPRPSEKLVALSLVAEWYDIDPEAKGLEDVESRLRILAGAGMVALKVWSEEFEEIEEGVEPSSEERAARRAQIMSRRAITEELAEGRATFNDYAATFRAEAHTRIVLDQQAKLERRVERLTESAQQELTRLIEALRESRDALDNALPGSDGAALKDNIGKLTTTIQTLEALISKKHGRKTGWINVWHRIVEVLWEATRIIIGIFLAGIVIFLIKLPIFSQIVKAGFDRLEHEWHAMSPAPAYEPRSKPEQPKTPPPHPGG